jgi:hypothetical protein
MVQCASGMLFYLMNLRRIMGAPLDMWRFFTSYNAYQRRYKVKTRSLSLKSGNCLVVLLVIIVFAVIIALALIKGCVDDASQAFRLNEPNLSDTFKGFTLYDPPEVYADRLGEMESYSCKCGYKNLERVYALNTSTNFTFAYAPITEGTVTFRNAGPADQPAWKLSKLTFKFAETDSAPKYKDLIKLLEEKYGRHTDVFGLSGGYAWERSAGKRLSIKKSPFDHLGEVKFGTTALKMNSFHRPQHDAWLHAEAMKKKAEEAKKAEYEERRTDDI